MSTSNSSILPRTPQWTGQGGFLKWESPMHLDDLGVSFWNHHMRTKRYVNQCIPVYTKLKDRTKWTKAAKQSRHMRQTGHKAQSFEIEQQLCTWNIQYMELYTLSVSRCFKMFQVHINRNQKDQMLLGFSSPCYLSVPIPDILPTWDSFTWSKLHLFEMFISRAISSRQLHQPLSQNPKGCRRGFHLPVP